jgi:peptidyl-prolyl cis-trans isomerase B (cyclophilin B)
MTTGPLVAATVLVAWILLSGSPHFQPAGQDQATGQGTTEIFVCGEDEKIPPLPVHWTNVVLAGDGRLTAPCQEGHHGADHREIREAALIGEARFSGNGEFRWRAAQAQARNSARPLVFPIAGERYPPPPRSPEYIWSQFDGLGGFVRIAVLEPPCRPQNLVFEDPASGLRWQPGRLFRMVDEPSGFAVRAWSGTPAQGSPDVINRRRIALDGAYAIGTLLSRPGLPASSVAVSTRDLRGCLEPTPQRRLSAELEQLMLEAIGLARYRRDADVTDAEGFLVRESHASPSRLFGAVKGLEALFRQHPEHRIGEAAQRRLRALLVHGARTTQPAAFETDARIRRLALAALEHAKDIDTAALSIAVTDADWQVRRIVARHLDLADPQQASLGAQLAGDAAFQVRLELLGAQSRHAATTHQCAPIIDRFRDPSPLVSMQAMDLLPSGCADLDQAVALLASQTDGLARSTRADWHASAKAFTTLARIRPSEARSRLEIAVKHDVWHVRAAAAAATAALGDEHSAAALARDAEPNVRSIALDALSRMRSASAVPMAIEVLTHGRDYQLLRTAAFSVRGVPDAAKTNVASALLAALDRLTAEAADTSREARVAIIERLPEVLDPLRIGELYPFAGDYDEKVREAAVTALKALGSDVPAVVPQRRRYPFQPPANALLSLPVEAVIQLEGGAVTLRLLPDVAPVTVARFSALASQGYYDGLTFHRVLPNFVVQGGSPAANDYAGTRRYMRDEVGPQGVHVRGAVGMSKRGPDTGDGQFFIDLVDLPHLDRDYTVFAYVTQGMEVVDRILPGAKIVRLSVK